MWSYRASSFWVAWVRCEAMALDTPVAVMGAATTAIGKKIVPAVLAVLK